MSNNKSLPSRMDQGKGLEREARDALRLTNRHLDRHGDGPEEDKPDEDGEEYEDLETEDDIIQRALDESQRGIGDMSDDEGARRRSSEKRTCMPDTPKDEEDPSTTLKDVDEEDLSSTTGGLSFPSLPTHAPLEDADETSEGQDAEMDARMARLLGLSGPSTLPGPTARLPSPPKEVKRAPGQGWNIPGYKDDRDDDPDSWCCESSTRSALKVVS